jgi:hypothetical protein
MPRAKTIAVIAAFHFVVSRLLFLWVFSMGMSRFDTGDPQSKVERIAAAASGILDFPVSLTLDLFKSLPGVLGYIPLACNSILWGAVLGWAFAAIRQYRVLYRVESDRILVEVVSVTAHDYRNK